MTLKLMGFFNSTFVDILFIMGWASVFIGLLFVAVFMLYLIDLGIGKIAKYLKVYPMLCDFIWERLHKKEKHG